MTQREILSVPCSARGWGRAFLTSPLSRGKRSRSCLTHSAQQPRSSHTNLKNTVKAYQKVFFKEYLSPVGVFVLFGLKYHHLRPTHRVWRSWVKHLTSSDVDSAPVRSRIKTSLSRGLRVKWLFALFWGRERGNLLPVYRLNAELI